jgi:glutathione S-transferase
MLKIYGIPTLNTTKVIFTAEYLGLDYDFVRMDFSKGEHKTPEHLQRHPLGKVPAIDHDGKFLFESNTIALYLARITESSLYPETVYQQAVVQQWIDMMTSHAGRWLAAHYFENFIKPTFLQGTPDESNLEEANGFLDIQLPAIDKQLENNTYMCGNEMSVADLIGFCFFNTCEVSGYDIGQYQSISNWYQNLRQSQAYTKTATLLGLPE